MKFLANFPHAPWLPNLSPPPPSWQSLFRTASRLFDALALLTWPQASELAAQEPPTTQPAAAAGTCRPALKSSHSQRDDTGSRTRRHSTPALDSSQSGEVTEEELKQALVGKQLFLRGGYLGDSISFNEHGLPVGHPASGSYTLSAVEIEKVHLTKHRVELEGSRYALHFLGALPSEDPNAIDRIKITPKKKTLKISIDRELVIKSKKVKEDKKSSKKPPNHPKAENRRHSWPRKKLPPRKPT